MSLTFLGTKEAEDLAPSPGLPAGYPRGLWSSDSATETLMPAGGRDPPVLTAAPAGGQRWGSLVGGASGKTRLASSPCISGHILQPRGLRFPHWDAGPVQELPLGVSG